MTVLVTGANRGLGLAFLKRLMASDVDGGVFFTVRSLPKGEATLQHLQGVSSDSCIRAKFEYLILDTSDPASISNLVVEIERRELKFDAVLLNAGIFIPAKIKGREVMESTLRTNLIGPTSLARALLTKSLIKERLVFVASSLGSFDLIQNLSTRQSLIDAVEGKSRETAVEDVWSRYMQEVLCGGKDEKWSMNFYGMSKLFLKLWAKAASHNEEWLPIKIVSCCPGWCRTDMTQGTAAPRDAQEGAETFYKVMCESIPFEKSGDFFLVDHWLSPTE